MGYIHNLFAYINFFFTILKLLSSFQPDLRNMYLLKYFIRLVGRFCEVFIYQIIVLKVEDHIVFQYKDTFLTPNPLKIFHL